MRWAFSRRDFAGFSMGVMDPGMSKYHVRKLRSSYVRTPPHSDAYINVPTRSTVWINFSTGLPKIMATVYCIDDTRPLLPLRVLVVDDFEPFRRFVCSTLQRKWGLLVVGEASDGLEAVQMSEKLQPNIIVLDIGLPILDGIEAARRIRAVSPLSKILFVSQESSPEIVQEAVSLGSGYVVKTHAGTELLAAAEALRSGDRFIGAGLPSFRFTNTANSRPPRSTLRM